MLAEIQNSDLPAIEFVEVIKSFGERRNRHTVLHSISFSIPRGKTTVIAGGSGQGKSVTLKLVVKVVKRIRPFGSSILLDK